MLTKIVVEGPASFKKRSEIQTDKKVNLIYGLNGTGKSTIGRFLQSPSDDAYAACEMHGDSTGKIFVFNEEFIQQNFYESEEIKGIFSLSKENKTAEAKIAEANRERTKQIDERKKVELIYQEKEKSLQSETARLLDKIFDIKREHSGGDRVLEFCLEGVMGNKERLLERLIGISKPELQPAYSMRDLQEEARLLAKTEGGSSEPTLPEVSIDLTAHETNPLLSKAIVGSRNSNFADFINQLQISDWVKQGIGALDESETPPLVCPFCQKETVDDHVLGELRAYFDQTFDDQTRALEGLEQLYKHQLALLPELQTYKHSLFYEESIEALHGRVRAELKENLRLLQDKVRSPSKEVSLVETKSSIDRLNERIRSINELIKSHNSKLSDIKSARRDIARRFWLSMRWSYDQSIEFHNQLVDQADAAVAARKKTTEEIDKTIRALEFGISEAQKDTVNIDEAVTNINAELMSIGVHDFKIKRHSDHLYKLERLEGGDGRFKSLSEGEKMIIALLYFCELCLGNESPEEVSGGRIVVLDDPVSSMSHIFVFNVGRLLLAKFFLNNLITQVFVFTHSLYFFYEMTDTDHERRKKNQALFRIKKGLDGSSIVPMKYEEIQNDYQAYWQVINDVGHHPALIANCMRNVIEYFFGFVERKSFNNLFQAPALQQNKFQAFSRYMNRESHSFAQNVFDIKEFDYEVFKEGMRLVFEISGYEKHFQQMTKA